MTTLGFHFDPAASAWTIKLLNTGVPAFTITDPPAGVPLAKTATDTVRLLANHMGTGQQQMVDFIKKYVDNKALPDNFVDNFVTWLENTDELVVGNSVTFTAASVEAESLWGCLDDVGAALFEAL